MARRRTTAPLIAFLLLACQSFGFGKVEEPKVFLAWHDRATRCAILIRDLDVPVEIQAPDPLPYASEEHAGIWIGARFPYEKAIEAIRFARYYYRDIRYLALSDYVTPQSDFHEFEMRIGTDTGQNLCLGLQAWTEADFEQLRGVANDAEFRSLIESHYAPSERLCADIE